MNCILSNRDYAYTIILLIKDSLDCCVSLISRSWVQIPSLAGDVTCMNKTSMKSQQWRQCFLSKHCTIQVLNEILKTTLFGSVYLYLFL